MERGKSPLGHVPPDSALADALKQHFPLLTEDADAHRSEHAIEVELPLLLACRADLAFVPTRAGYGSILRFPKTRRSHRGHN